MSDNVIYLSNYARSNASNVVNDFVTDMTDFYGFSLNKYNIDTNNLETAFDVATIQFLLRGMAHRSQGEEHPSQLVLNALRNKMFPE
jgi:hypothetical protein